MGDLGEQARSVEAVVGGRFAGLRCDKVVRRLMERLKAHAAETVPDGLVVALTVTAPIRLPSKTAAALEDRIRTLRDDQDMVHGNRVQIRILRDNSRQAPKLIGFVHNSDTDPLPLLNMTAEMIELPGAAGYP